MRLSNIVSRYLREIATAWPEFQFATPDGRVFAMIDDSINSIIFRIQARGHIPALWERVALHKIRGAIIEVDTYDPPLIFEDRLEMLQAWLQLHDTFHVEMTEEEWDICLGTSGSMEAEDAGAEAMEADPDTGSEPAAH